MGEITYDEEAKPLDDYESSVVEGGDLARIAAMYRDVYDEVEVLSKQMKKLEHKKKFLAEEFCKRLYAEGLSQIKTDEGTFSPKIETRIAIRKEHEDAVFDELDQANLGLVKRTVHWRSLQKAYEEGNLDGIFDTDRFSSWDAYGIRIRRS